MITMFIIIILVIAMLGVVGWSVLSFQRAAETASVAQRNVSRMEGIVSLLRNSIRFDQALQIYEVQMDDAWTSASTGRILVPTQIAGDGHTPWGGSYAFCPLSPGGLNGATATVNGGANVGSQYQISYRQIADQNGHVHSYVTGMSWPWMPASIPPNILGLVISPSPMSTALPNCTDVVYQNGYYMISISASASGTVTPVSTAGIILTNTLSQPATPAIYVAPVATGLGNGTSAANAMALGDSAQSALYYWSQNLPNGVTFIVTPGTYYLTESDASLIPSSTLGVPAADLAPVRSFIYFEGPTTGTATLSGVGGAATDLYLGVNTQIDGNISIAPSMTVHVNPFTQVSFKNVGTIGHLSVEGGTAVVLASALTTVNVLSGHLVSTTGSVGTASIWTGDMTLNTPTLQTFNGYGGQSTLNFTSGGMSTITTPMLSYTSLGGQAALSFAAATVPMTIPFMGFNGGQTTINSSEPLTATSAEFLGGSLNLIGTQFVYAFPGIGSTLGNVFSTYWSQGFQFSLNNYGATASNVTLYYQGNNLGTYTSAKTLLDSTASFSFVQDSGAGCVATNGSPSLSSCNSYCTAAYPYFVSGECAGTAALLTSASQLPGSTGWACTWEPDVTYTQRDVATTAAPGSAVVTGSMFGEVANYEAASSMSTTAHCTSIPH